MVKNVKINTYDINSSMTKWEKNGIEYIALEFVAENAHNSWYFKRGSILCDISTVWLVPLKHIVTQRLHYLRRSQRFAGCSKQSTPSPASFSGPNPHPGSNAYDEGKEQSQQYDLQACRPVYRPRRTILSGSAIEGC